MRNTLRKTRPGDIETELERLPSYTSTLSQVPQPETAHINRGGPSGEPLPAYAPTANTTLMHDMKAAQKSQRPGPEPTTIEDNVDIEANQPNSNTNNPADVPANRPAAGGRTLVAAFALMAMMYCLTCLLYAVRKWDYVKLKDDTRVRIAVWAIVSWSFPFASMGVYIYGFCLTVAERRNFTRWIILTFCISTLVPSVGHVLFAFAGPTPNYDYLMNGTTTSHNYTVLANRTAPTDLTAMYNLAARAIFL
ncbi:hypothetical protein LTR70_006348 [Exophiala xenobiotica]|uniref:Uncharacterized protein n=1 Tax=Lithohypha guttulata TaxID=1690604 RepID=A0ABR0K808_9EURO|nr:hypothetical protein LTR24_005817 [Lithohypha guttulata]KAK5316293.1 hypothetical protein LTR70_006348 [Exophiala xenobiotica]